MSNELMRLLKSHRFLEGAMRQHGDKLLSTDADKLKRDIDRIFLEIIRHPANDPQVTLAQCRFLIKNLVDMAAEPTAAETFQAICKQHLDQLEHHIQRPKAAPAPSRATAPAPLEYRYLDSLAHRVAVLDSSYRYVFTNQANAAFHREDASGFIGRPAWQTTGDAYFERFNKPRFDAAFAGRPVSYSAPHPCRDPQTIYAVIIDPIRSADGSVRSIIVNARNVSEMDQLTDHGISGRAHS